MTKEEERAELVKAFDEAREAWDEADKAYYESREAWSEASKALIKFDEEN